MLKFLLKSGVVIQSSILLYGYYNGHQSTKPSNNMADKFNPDNFKQIFENDKNRSKPLSLNRNSEIEKLKTDNFDILIIGGGCSGGGVLLEAYQRGLKCALIEGNDFAAGTSSRSTKLIHGGIRYLQEAFTLSTGFKEKVMLVFEALRERDFLLTSAPFMNRVIEIKFTYGNFFFMNYYYAGLVFYHLMYAIQNFPDVHMIIPGPRINKDKTVSFFEGQMFDSRQALLTILTTTRENYTEQSPASIVCNYIEFKGYLYGADNKIIGIKAFDKVNGKEVSIYAKQVVNCTGIYGDSNFSKEDKLKDKLIISSQGMHVVIDKKLFNINMEDHTGHMIPQTSDGRVLFILPYFNDRYVLIGTTDNIVTRSLTPLPGDDDLSYIMKEIRNNFAYTGELKPTSVWAGIRPLVRQPSGDVVTKSISRGHVVRYDNETGLVSLLGGKWTTYRQMGEDVVEKVLQMNKELETKAHTRYTSIHNLRLLGGKYGDEDIITSYNDDIKYYSFLKEFLASKYNISKSIVNDLVFKYGTLADDILKRGKGNNTNRPIIGDILLSELLYCIDCELVIKANDFICRRTGLAFVDLQKAEEAIPVIAEEMGKYLRWSRSRINEEINESKNNLKYML
jgi:glycerol-3-phosphate dehydrogenase